MEANFKSCAAKNARSHLNHTLHKQWGEGGGIPRSQNRRVWARGRRLWGGEGLVSSASADAQMKVFIAQESTNGENFIQPLDGCRDVLER